MPISSRTRSKRPIFSIDSDSSGEDTPVILPVSPTTALYKYTNTVMEAASAVDTSSEEFKRAVQTQVEQAIRDMVAAGTLASPSAASGSSGSGGSGSSSGSPTGGGTGGSILPASPTSVVYSTDPFRSNFNPGDKHGASLFKTATEPLPEKERYTLSQDKAKKLLLHIKSKAATYFWGPIVTKIPQSYPIVPAACKSLLLSPNKVSMNSVMRSAAKCWAKMTAVSNKVDFDSYILKYPHLVIAPIDPGNVPGDDLIFYKELAG